MDAIEGLMQEHRQIEKALVRLERVADGLQPGDRTAQKRMKNILAFFAGYADDLHHGKEEQLLFSRLCELGLSDKEGPVAAMRAEHEESRRLIADMRRLVAGPEELDEARVAQLVDDTARFIDLMREHVRKEDKVLYVLARGILHASAAEMLDEACAAYDDAHREKTARLLALAGA